MHSILAILSSTLLASVAYTSHITRRSFVGVFDPAVIVKERNGVLTKYANADQIIKNLSSNLAALDIAALYPNGSNAAFISPGRPLTSRAPDSGIPGRKGRTYAIMPTKDFIVDGQDVLYYGPLNIGTPAQPMTVDLDTGSADLWVPVGCSTCANAQFKNGASISYEETGAPFDVYYGSGEVHGKIVKDTVSVGGLQVSGQPFGAVDQLSEDFNSYPNSGLIGVAFGSIARSTKRTFFENLIAQGKLIAPLFSVHLERGKETGSEVCFGCYNYQKVTGPVKWVPVYSKTYWTVAMDGIIVNQKGANSPGVIAAIDTGTTLIYVPDSVAAAMYKLIPGSAAATQFGQGLYTFPCASELVISLSFGGHSFSISLDDFNLGRISAKSKDCVGGILSLGQNFPPDLAIVGDEFLKSWYTTYDYSDGARVGFSPSVNNAEKN